MQIESQERTKAFFSKGSLRSLAYLKQILVRKHLTTNLLSKAAQTCEGCLVKRKKYNVVCATHLACERNAPEIRLIMTSLTEHLLSLFKRLIQANSTWEENKRKGRQKSNWKKSENLRTVGKKVIIRAAHGTTTWFSRNRLWVKICARL